MAFVRQEENSTRLVTGGGSVAFRYRSLKVGDATRRWFRLATGKISDMKFLAKSGWIVMLPAGGVKS